MLIRSSSRILNIDYAKKALQTVCGPVTPQLTFILDVDPDVGLARSNKN